MQTTCMTGDVLPTSDQSRASHSGGQLWLLQGSVREGRRGVHAASSRTFSSVPEILLLHNTSRVRRPPLQLRLHSDHSPVHQLEAEKSWFALHNVSALNILKEYVQETLTLGSMAQYCRIFSSLWVCSSCHRSGCRRLNDLSASYTPPAGSAHLTTGETTWARKKKGLHKGHKHASTNTNKSAFSLSIRLLFWTLCPFPHMESASLLRLIMWVSF